MINYSFPGVPAPFDHQKETFEFILNRRRCFVFDDIGTGKTFSAAWAAHYLIKTGQVNRVLIVAPLSTLTVVWKRSLFHVDPQLDVEVLKGSAQDKWNGWASCKQGIRIINPDSLHILSQRMQLGGRAAAPDLLIIDESAMFRKQSARRSKALGVVCAYLGDRGRIVMMTGSPTPEAPTDVWFTARIVCPDRVPKYFSRMRDLLMKKISQWKWVNLPQADQTLAKMLEGYVIRHTRDALDLPPTQTCYHEIETTADAHRLLKELKDEAAAEVEAGVITGANEAVVRSKMLQVVSGAVKASNEGKRNNVLQRVDVATKFAALRELLDASRQPVIIYSEFIGALAQVSLWLHQQGVSFGVVVGDTSPDKRVDTFDALQRGDIKVLLAHPRAMAHGITLTTSNVALWWTPIDSHEIFDQASGRITRATQIRKTYIIVFGMSALERRVYQNLQSKQKFQGMLFEYLMGEEV
jgi:SNF2 family DNA or RNA helicase